jgi:hypothetical protein
MLASSSPSTSASSALAFTAASIDLDGFANCVLPGICLEGRKCAFETEWFTSDAIAARCANPPGKGERLRVYVEILGPLEGKVIARTASGFRLALVMSERDRAKFKGLIGAIKERAAAGLPLGRRHERIVPVHRQVSVVDANGGLCSGRIVDLSRSGASVKVEGVFEVGDSVRIGERTEATVVRPIEGGMAVQFISFIPFEEFTKHVRL